MGALDDFLAGGKGVQPEDMALPKESVITDQILDNLRRTESGKDNLAVNKKTKAMGAYQFLPETVQMLHKQGYEFNPFNEKEARGAAKHYLETLVKQNNGDLNKAIAQYGGHVTADPTKYIASVTKNVPVSQTTGSALDDFLSSAEPAPQRGAVHVEVSGGQAPQQTAQPAAQPVAQPAEDTLTKVGRTAAGLVDTLVGGLQTLPGMALAETGYAGVRALEGLGLAEPGRAERGREAAYKAFVEPYAKPVGETLGITQTPEYKGEASQQAMQFISENLDKGADWISAKTGIPKADVQNMMNTLMVAAPAIGKGAKATLQAQFAAKKPIAPKVEPTFEKPKVTYQELQQQLENKKKAFQIDERMAGVGAAKTADATMLAEAKAKATPELRAELERIKPGDLNVEALNRIMEADQLPVPVRYTRGQATQDPNLISRERNERGLKEQYVERFNEQNRALQENVAVMKERVAPDLNTTSFVEDAEGAIGRMSERINADDAKITEAYNALRDYGAGKLQVDSQSFANGALKALSEFDEQEFLPSSIQNRLNSYKEGKPMNFNQFENLRTVLARETRKAQAANDGNMVHALTVVRSELEKMPLIGETGEAKVLADKARSLAKSQFDLLDKKRSTYDPLYADVMNGIADTKDFIPKLIFRSKNKDFVKTIETISQDPEGLQYFRSGALDYMLRESTDGNGNFLPKKFNNFVNLLDVNKKLDPLFGDQAKTIRAIGNASKNVEARPAGSFVNESGTAVALGQMAKQYGGNLAKRIPGVGAVIEPAQQIIEQRRAAKEVKQTLKPAAGVRLSDIGKKK